jgi:hypothetical protein
MTTRIEEDGVLGSAPIEQIILPLWRSDGPLKLLVPRFMPGERINYFRRWSHPSLESYRAQNSLIKTTENVVIGSRFEFRISYSINVVRDPWYIERVESTQSLRIACINDLFVENFPEELRLAVLHVAEKELNGTV